MIRFGVIGTNWITEEFIRCARLAKEFELRAVYSRSLDTATQFAAKHKAIHVFTDLAQMAQSKSIDAVYIASPNSLHAEQSLLFLRMGKHVLCEKPLASNLAELESMYAAARSNKVLLMEAMKTTLLPNYIAIKENLARIGQVRSAYFSFCQYSARYDLLKQGELPNVFNPLYSSGSLMDIGIYCLYPAMDLFGLPETITAQGVILRSGVDGSGTVTLGYGDKVAVLHHSKITHSTGPSEIQGELGSIVIDKVSKPGSVEIHYLDGSKEDITRGGSGEAMYYEAQEFINLIRKGQTESSINTYNLARSVMQVLDEARRQLGINFPADEIGHQG